MIDQIGRYRIIERLGQGGFGDVYLAEDTVLGHQVALKVLAAHYLRDPTVVERFRQEARAAARLRHPHIVRIFDLDEAEGILFLVMDYLPGRTLDKIVAEEDRIELHRTAALLAQIASALDYAHNQGLVHRDVKPGNVIVDESGGEGGGEGGGDHATLTDFGLVKAVEGTEYSVLQITSDSERYTTGGSMMGTPEYMAPEQAEPSLGPVGRRTDVYALGIVAYQMLTGRVPFKGSTPIATLRGHVDLEPPPPDEWVDLPEQVTAALMRALAKRPEERWGEAGGFIQALTLVAKNEAASRAKEEEILRLYAQAQAAVELGEWTRALSLCGQVMERRSGYKDIDAMFLQASEGLTRQKEWEAQQAELAGLYEAAARHSEQEAWDEAIAAWKKILDIGGEYVYLDTPQRLDADRAARDRQMTERAMRLEELREQAIEALADHGSCLVEMEKLQPGDAGLARRREVTGAMLSSWHAEPGTPIMPPSDDAGNRRDGPAAESPGSGDARLQVAVAILVGTVAILVVALIVTLALRPSPRELEATFVPRLTQTAGQQTTAPSSAPEATPGVQRMLRAVFEVDAANDWQDTGIYVPPGEDLSLYHVSGVWSNCLGCDWPYTDAGGLPELPLDYHDNFLVGCPHGALIARFSGGEPFCVGAEHHRIDVRAGILELRTNDTKLGDNDGSIMVRIETG